MVEKFGGSFVVLMGYGRDETVVIRYEEDHTNTLFIVDLFDQRWGK